MLLVMVIMLIAFIIRYTKDRLQSQFLILSLVCLPAELCLNVSSFKYIYNNLINCLTTAVNQILFYCNNII